MRTALTAFTALLVLASCAGPRSTPLHESTPTVYLGGTILTMTDERPTAEAVAVEDGRIVAVGSEEDVLRLAPPGARRVDLRGRTMLPGFVDSHGHAYGVGLQASTANLLPPPDGEGADIAALQTLLRDWAAAYPERVERVGWIAGFGYDDSQLAERRHPTRDDLDRVSTEVPVLAIHQSGHLGVVNSKALQLAGITAETDDPKGGAFRRREGSREPNGVCEEYAFFAVLAKLAERLDDEVNDALVLSGVELLAEYGYTTAQEGRATGPGLDALRRVASRGELPIDLVAYPDILEVQDIDPSPEYRGRFRVGGVKLTIDGSPQGKTAWLTEPYFVPPPGKPADYRGYPAVDAETTRGAVREAFANGWQILCHANGDAAIDSFIGAVREARAAHPDADVRPVLIHGQTLREDQVDELQELEIFPSLFPMHTFYWGDWHRESVLGPERAENISPTGWLRERGMIFGSHHDAPVALPDSMRVLSATVTRTSRTGRVLGPEHRTPVMDALKALTVWPAWQHFEEDRKGTIEVGKLADFVVLSDDPNSVPPDRLDDLEIEETIKEGVTVYRRDPERSASAPTPALFGVTRVAGSLPRPLDAVARGDGCFNPAMAVLLLALEGADRDARRRAWSLPPR